VNEHGFTKAVLNRLPAGVHKQSMTQASLANNGTPDRYLDLHRDLWIEFKYHPAFPHVLKPTQMLRPLQLRWLTRRWRAGGNAIVVVGFEHECKSVGVVLGSPFAWSLEYPRSDLRNMMLTIPEITADILHRIS